MTCSNAVFSAALRCSIAAAALLASRPVRAKTLEAVDCSAAAVQQAIEDGTSGDTIAVPAGTCTWSTLVSVGGKDLVIEGAGQGLTQITAATNGILDLADSSSRLTGFTIATSADPTNLVRVANGEGWRIHNNTFSATNQTGGNRTCIYIQGKNDGPHPVGVIDHNTFENCRIMVVGDAGLTRGTFWTQPTGWGTNNGVFVEDNVFQYTREQGNCVDSQYSARYIVRFNELVGCPIEAHSSQNGFGARSWEVYGNRSTPANNDFMATFLRGGTGIIFGNTFDPGWTQLIRLDNVRSAREGGAGWGACDGTSPIDGNLGAGSSYPAAGWPCRGQIGRGADGFLFSNGNPPYPTQASEPTPIFLNRAGTSPAFVSIVNGAEVHIADCVEIQIERAGFDGSCGTGVGIAANRPAHCTPGVYYWTTDEGDWNAASAGADGRLYKCTATDTWSLYYTPYDYPHPLALGEPIPPEPDGAEHDSGGGAGWPVGEGGSLDDAPAHADPGAEPVESTCACHAAGAPGPGGWSVALGLLVLLRRPRSPRRRGADVFPTRRGDRHPVKWASAALVACMLAPGRADAACKATGTSAWLAAGRAIADLEECEDAAASGDTVVVPAGSVTWSGTGDFREKDINWVGGNGSPGQVVVNYTLPTNTIMTLLGRCSSLSGFEFVANFSTSNAMVVAGETTCGTNRIHHNTFRNTNTSSYPDGLSMRSASGGAHTTGVVDNNTFIRLRTSIRGGDDNQHANPAGWDEFVPFGSGQKVVFYEDNICYFTKTGSGLSPCIEPHHGGRVVVRYNVIDCAYLEAHGGGGEGQARSSQHFEAYLNQFAASQTPCNTALPRIIMRGGGGYIWGNVYSAALSENGARARLDADTREGTAGRCDGSSAEDGNLGSGLTFPPAGYPCIDAPGRVQDLTHYDGVNHPANGQRLQPVAFFWNRRSSTITMLDTNGTEPPVGLLAPNYYSTTTVNQNGTAFVANYAYEGANLATGPIATRPPCDGSVTYFWATDQGTWNCGSNSYYTEQGKLYYCDPVVAEWDDGREPYSYPHPVRNEKGCFPNADGGPGGSDGGVEDAGASGQGAIGGTSDGGPAHAGDAAASGGTLDGGTAHADPRAEPVESNCACRATGAPGTGALSAALALLVLRRRRSNRRALEGR